MHQIVLAIILIAVSLAAPAEAGVATKVVQEAFEFTTRKFAKEAVEEGVEQLSKRMTRLAARHGDDVVAAAFKKVGPKAGRLVAEAGEQQADVVLKVLAKHGDKALPFVNRPSALKLVGKFGDDAAETLIKHGAIGEQLLGQLGDIGPRLLKEVSPQNGRRLAILSADGSLTPPLLEVIARGGNKAADFVWKNKGALAVGATLTAFLASPETFLDGTTELATTVTEHVVQPLAEIPQVVAQEAARGTNWTLVWILLAGLIALAILAWGEFSGLRKWSFRCFAGWMVWRASRRK